MKRSVVRKIALEVLLLAGVLVVLIPLYMIVVDSLKNGREAALFGLGLPNPWKPSNYLEVFQTGGVLRGYMNSIVIAGFSLLVISFTASLAAFSIQRNASRLTNAVYYLFVLGLVVPVSIVPTIELLMKLGLHNTYLGMIFYYSAVLMPFSVFLLTGYLRTIPRELDESAFMDGCRPLRLFWLVILPIMRPALITTCLLTVMWVWNDFLGPFYLLSDSQKWTVTVTMFSYIGQYTTNWGLVFADITVVSLPIIIMYFLSQRYIVEGMTAGALKG